MAPPRDPAWQPEADLLLAGGFGVRWFRDRTAIGALARDHGVSRATAYRYVDEVIEVPFTGLPTALKRARAEGLAFVIWVGG